MRFLLTTKVWKDGRHFVAYTPELDLASQGRTPAHAEERLREAVSLFFEETRRMGTFGEVMRQAGFLKRHRRWEAPRVSIGSLEVAV
ncbi:MAG: hypothetical protein A3B37_03550 [Candidatus Sungbacteria bacterium RIFCSPLOWO2_01_FULL_59_16]|uniref:HicB-like antitoxin of toxin-antitoxin system domain-containing protein n=1 Tax=Candidatus Sungbacteria bacterium RIFCSPLOWO2_01_FULL_59_16 TaxID=1802280 RepID=A0A1G2LCD2_9BACT|nr:MAG: hypothetical protein A3B37_03550 [Candidatus Sungbacteria bacterium RIFCSPLOWO2_01_FULL_59_16]